MSLDEVIRCLGINFLLMGYLVCATLVHIAINSSKILKHLEKIENKICYQKGKIEALIRREQAQTNAKKQCVGCALKEGRRSDNKSVEIKTDNG